MKQNRWLFNGIIVAVFIYHMMIHAWAQQDIQVLFNNQRLVFDQPPIIRDGRTLVPMRAVFEAFDLEVIWNDKDRSVSALNQQLVIVLKIDDKKAMVNGEEHTLDVPATIVGNRTMVPLRFVGESLGATVSWEEKSRTVMIERQSGDQQRMTNSPKNPVFSNPIQSEIEITDLTEENLPNPIELMARGNYTGPINPDIKEKDIHAQDPTQEDKSSETPKISNEQNNSMDTVSGALQFSTGIYTGEISNGKANGEGVLKLDNGDQYAGSFQNNRYHGYGVFTWNSKNRQYEGYWENGGINGQGTMNYENGDIFKGYWQNGKRHGQGDYQWKNGDTYEGDWQNDQMHGQGKMVQGQNIFEGKWEENEFKGIVLRAGYEAVDLEDGSRYVGNLQDGQANGKGTMTYANGDSYDGDWNAGQMHGQGTLTFNNGDSYTGDWNAGQMNGQGTMAYANGDRYTGNWKNGLRNGTGKYIYAQDEISGYYYEGEWNNNLKHGQGIYYDHTNRKIYEGDWKESWLDGEGTRYFANGDVYEGNWKKDEMHGQGTMKFANGDSYEGNWNAGQMDGDGQMKFADNDMYDGKWENGMYAYGVYKWNDNSEKEQYEGYFSNNVPHGQGIFTFKDKNNTIKIEAKFVQGGLGDEVSLTINGQRKVIDLKNVNSDDKKYLEKLPIFSETIKIKKLTKKK